MSITVSKTLLMEFDGNDHFLQKYRIFIDLFFVNSRKKGLLYGTVFIKRERNIENMHIRFIRKWAYFLILNLMIEEYSDRKMSIFSEYWLGSSLYTLFFYVKVGIPW